MNKKRCRYAFVIYSIIFVNILFSAVDVLQIKGETSDPAEISVVESIEQAGTYPMELTTYDPETQSYITEVRYVTVVFPRTVVSEKYKEGIDASSVIVEHDTLNKISDVDLIILAKARAWSTSDGSSIPIEKVDKKLIDKKNKIFEISFSTIKGTTVIVHMMESEQVNFPLSITKLEQYFIYPNLMNILWRQTFNITLLFALLFIITLYIYYYTNKNVKEVESILYEKQEQR